MTPRNVPPADVFGPVVSFWWRIPLQFSVFSGVSWTHSFPPSHWVHDGSAWHSQPKMLFWARITGWAVLKSGEEIWVSMNFRSKFCTWRARDLGWDVTEDTAASWKTHADVAHLHCASCWHHSFLSLPLFVHLYQKDPNPPLLNASGLLGMSAFSTQCTTLWCCPQHHHFFYWRWLLKITWVLWKPFHKTI